MSTGLEPRGESLSSRLMAGVGVVALALVVAWGVELVDAFLGNRLDAYGIRPRSSDGLEGFVLAPLLHAGFGHLISNSLIFAVLGVVAYASVTAMRFWALMLISTLSSGLGAWLLGTPGTVVIGASGIVFGLLGFLLLRGLAERSPGAITISIMVIFVYGGTLAGILPGLPYVSWQAHLGGFLGGIYAAFLLRDRRRRVDWR